MLLLFIIAFCPNNAYFAYFIVNQKLTLNCETNKKYTNKLCKCILHGSDLSLKLKQILNSLVFKCIFYQFTYCIYYIALLIIMLLLIKF